jgi:hypothetical protein
MPQRPAMTGDARLFSIRLTRYRLRVHSAIPVPAFPVVGLAGLVGLDSADLHSRVK